MENLNLTVKLKFPVEHNGGLIGELNFRRMTVRDILQAEKFKNGTELEKDMRVLGNLTEQPMDVIEKLDMVDMLGEVSDLLSALMGNE
ncbi:phage tail assembly protein [Sinobacterium caligoides]|nr:phage tail assembly protein [Sinobacterium caligoides]